jgi:hypothetical protein
VRRLAQRPTLVPADDQGMGAAAFNGTWTSEAPAGSYGGSVNWAATSANATIAQTSFTVSGNAAWISNLGPDRNLAQVQVDNGKAEVIDLYSLTIAPAQIV